MPRRGRWTHWSGGVLIVGLVGVLCTGIGIGVAASRSTRASSTTPGVLTSPYALARERAALAESVAFTPSNNATNVPLDQQVVVATHSGTLIAVHASLANGWPLPGTVDVTTGTWKSDASLAQGTKYNVTARVQDAAGLVTVTSSSFTTLTPTLTVSASLFPLDNMTVGIAQPVVIRFSRPVTTLAAQMTALAHFKVAASVSVAGGWHWFSATELHYRPRTYWPSGEKLTVTSNLDGWNAGDGGWGTGSHSVKFSVGDAHIATANLQTLQMTVTDNGKVIATYPFSGGRPKYPTMNGQHIVLDRESVVHMVSSTNGIPVNSPDGYDELVYQDVHISDSGEYVHAAPWSVNDQGHMNVSHGCINLSNADALAFFNFSRIGDVVNVVGGPRPPALGDHGVMDWDTPWSAWTVAPTARA